jgi:hypothetical protein
MNYLESVGIFIKRQAAGLQCMILLFREKLNGNKNKENKSEQVDDCN